MSSFEEEYIDNDSCECKIKKLKIIELLELAKLIIKRLSDDVCDYVNKLENLQENFQNCNLNCNEIIDSLEHKLNKLAELFFWGFSEHLSITTNCIGNGNRIIRPVNQEFGYVTTYKIQNVTKNCEKCHNSRKKFLEKKTIIGKLNNYLKIQPSTNIATYDNISILKEIDKNMTVGYIIKIGNLSYMLNTTFGDIKNIILYDTSNEIEKCSFDKTKIINKKSIDKLFNFIDKQIEILSDIEVSLLNNILFIDKYINKIIE